MTAMFKNTPFDLTGRTALVTGAGRGLGKAMARQLSQAGAGVMLCSRTESQLREAADEIREETGGLVEYSVADLGDRKDTVRLASETTQRLGKVDILIANAGLNIPQTIDQLRDEDWDHLLELNLSSSMALTRALAPGMMERKWGRVIYISSIMALASTKERVAYSASKAGLHGLVKANAIHLGAHGITVNCIAPGPFATEMPMRLLTPEQKQQLASRTALGRWAKPEELAPTALLLASEAGGYITGTIVVVDGGASIRMF